MRFLPFLFVALTAGNFTLFAGDGVDNNYIGIDANSMFCSINYGGVNFVYGPGMYSFGVPIPANSTYNAGNVIDFSLSSVNSTMRSAYYDRVLTTTLYYRIFLESDPPADPSANLSNFPNSAFLDEVNTPIPESSCLTSSLDDPWRESSLGINVLSGLTLGNNYILEFFVEATLKDVGVDEYDPSNCTSLDPDSLCQNTSEHDRVLRSTFNTTDPNHCNYASIVSSQSLPHRIKFKYVSALPLSWTAFSAERLATDVKLQWKTELEWNVDHFDIERSDDAAQWQVIDALGVANDGLSAHTYTYIDMLAAPHSLFYRLRAVDFDQKYQYSPAVGVGGIASATLSVQPNPAGTHTDIFVDRLAHVQIFSPSGVLFLDKPEAEGVVRVETFDWPNGVYRVMVLDASGKQLERRTLVVSR